MLESYRQARTESAAESAVHRSQHYKQSSPYPHHAESPMVMLAWMNLGCKMECCSPATLCPPRWVSMTINIMSPDNSMMPPRRLRWLLFCKLAACTRLAALL